MKAEVDDRLTPLTAELVPVDSLLEDHINAIVDQARMETRGALDSQGDWSEAQKEQLLRKVYNLLGAYKKGTGIFVGAFGIGKEVSLHPEIVYWMAHHLDDKKNQIVFLKFKQTRYGVNVVGTIEGKVIAHKSRKAADHSIAPVVKIRDVLLGTDKWGHFFMQGYWYWSSKFSTAEERFKYGQYMEGDPALPAAERAKFEAMAKKWIANFRFGYFGGWSTGVISMADLKANEGGYQFYSRLYNDPDGYRFSLDDFATFLPMMNEQANPSKFSYGVDVDDAAEPVSVETETERLVSLLRAASYTEALTEGERIVKKMDLVPDYYTLGSYREYKALRDAAWFYYMRCKEPSEPYSDAAPSATLTSKYGLPAQPTSCQN